MLEADEDLVAVHGTAHVAGLDEDVPILAVPRFFRGDEAEALGVGAQGARQEAHLLGQSVALAFDPDDLPAFAEFLDETLELVSPVAGNVEAADELSQGHRPVGRLPHEAEKVIFEVFHGDSSQANTLQLESEGGDVSFPPQYGNVAQ